VTVDFSPAEQEPLVDDNIKTMPKKKRPLIGIQLPVAESTNKRSSTAFNKNVWIASAQGLLDQGENLDSDERQQLNQFVQDIQKEKDWRWQYEKYIKRHMRLSKRPDNCLNMAQAGLDYVYKNLEVYREENGAPQTIDEAMSTPNPNLTFETGIIQGSLVGKPETRLKIPYKGKHLTTKNAINQVDYWDACGVIEEDTRDVLRDVIQNDRVVNSISNKVFVLLGAISEMGPLQQLLNWGATVVGVDLHLPHIQKKLFDFAKHHPGKLIVPLKPGCASRPQEEWTECAGVNLLTDFPEVAEWLVGIEPEKEMIIGQYCYLDGEMFIKIVASMDAICKSVAERRQTKTGFAMLATPTDCHTVYTWTVAAALGQANGLVTTFLAQFCEESYPDEDKVGEIPFVCGIVSRQGPNYILAKRMQTWRAMLSRQSGIPVSMNVAPTTKTISVVKNKLFAFAMDGCENFEPYENFETPTTKAVMTALMCYDFTTESSSANPQTILEHPLCLLQKTQCHGGMYRTGYKFSSMANPGTVIQICNKIGLFILLGVCFFAWWIYK